MGRWISPDPAGLAAVDPSNPQSWNRYAYVGNNPLSMIDPLGLNGCTVNPSGSLNCPDAGGSVTVYGLQTLQPWLTTTTFACVWTGLCNVQPRSSGNKCYFALLDPCGARVPANNGPSVIPVVQRDNGKSIPNVPPEWGFCSKYRDGSGGGSALYDICMNSPNFPSQKWAGCVRGKLLNKYVPNGNPLDLTWYLFVDHPVDFLTCPIN